MKLLGKSASYANIIAYMTDDEAAVELTEHEKQLVDRWNQAWALTSRHTTADAVAILMKRFPGISRATAYRDCANATCMFGDISKATKEGIKHLSTELIKEGAVLARAKNDSDGLIKAGVAIAKVNGANVNDPDLPDFSKLEPHTYEVVTDDITTRALKWLISNGRIDLTMLTDAMQQMAIDTEFTEVKPGEDNAS